MRPPSTVTEEHFERVKLVVQSLGRIVLGDRGVGHRVLNMDMKV